MGNERRIYRRSAPALLPMLTIFVLFLLFQMSFANAQSVVLTEPVNGPVTSPFGNTGSRYHQGVDYGVPTGTSITPRGNVQCMGHSSTAGVWAVVEHGCCVQERWLHLLKCSATDIKTDNTGSSTGPHLHWDVNIKGVRVDGRKAAGQNLCDENVQKTLIEDGRARYPKNGGGGASSTEACKAPAPTQQPTDTVTYDPGTPGTPATPTSPATPGTPPTVITITPDGRITVDPVVVPGQPPPPLPPSVTDGLTQPAATNNELTGCATDTWEAMVNQSVLQTRREMAINETLVAKADSVMAYACLKDQIEITGESTGPIFSETKLWANKNIDIIGKTVTVQRELGEESLDGALANTALHVLTQFVNDSFTHGWLGEIPGSGQGAPAAHDHAAAGHGEDGDESPQADAHCGVMAQVWKLAKCLNVVDKPGWPKFVDLIGQDPRQYPLMFACSDTGISQGMIDIAQGSEVLYDPMDPFDDFFPVADNCDAPPIKTGVTVQRQMGGFISTIMGYDDRVCITPGCSFSVLNGARCTAN